MNQLFLKELMEIMAGEVLCHESMKRHTTFRIGGPADYYIVPDRGQLADAIACCRKHHMHYVIIGNGSNLLVRDGGIRGLVIEIGKALSGITIEGNMLVVGAGEMMGRVASAALDAELSGMECLAGIPGTIGGAVVMNAGAYGSEMKDVLTRVTVYTPEGVIRTVDAAELDLGYRHSNIPEREYIVLEAQLCLSPGRKSDIQGKMAECRDARISKQPLEYPSAGSTFKRPEGYFAGKLIDDAGLRGYGVGDAQVSEKHCGFVINRGNASAVDVLALMEDVKQKVFAQFGVLIEPEVKIIGE